MALEIVARLGDLPQKGTLAIEHGGEKIVLARSEMGVFARIFAGLAAGVKTMLRSAKEVQEKTVAEAAKRGEDGRGR